MERVLSQRNIILFAFALVLSVALAMWAHKIMVQTSTIPVTIAKPIALPITDAIPISIPHPNSDQNKEPHIVYEIFYTSPIEERLTLKYGISSQLDYKVKEGNPRPELQCNFFQKKPRYSKGIVSYVILHRAVPGRIAAKEIEQTLVSVYFFRKKQMPAEQLKPLPIMQ